jgi:putative FmdB family regulatory protein
MIVHQSVKERWTMPLYEYKCGACGHCFEVLVRDKNTPACPACHAENVERQLSLFAVRSEGTRQTALQAARRQTYKTERDRAVAAEEDTHHDH